MFPRHQHSDQPAEVGLWYPVPCPTNQVGAITILSSLRRGFRAAPGLSFSQWTWLLTSLVNQTTLAHHCLEVPSLVPQLALTRTPHQTLNGPTPNLRVRWYRFLCQTSLLGEELRRMTQRTTHHLWISWAHHPHQPVCQLQSRLSLMDPHPKWPVLEPL